MIVLKGKSYTCTYTKSILGHALTVMIDSEEFFLFTIVFLQPFSLFSFLCFFLLPPFSLNPFSCYILRFLYHFLHPRVSQVLGVFSVPVHPSLNLLLLAVRLLVYCSGITSRCLFNAVRKLAGQYLMRR